MIFILLPIFLLLHPDYGARKQTGNKVEIFLSFFFFFIISFFCPTDTESQINRKQNTGRLRVTAQSVTLNIHPGRGSPFAWEGCVLPQEARYLVIYFCLPEFLLLAVNCYQGGTKRENRVLKFWNSQQQFNPYGWQVLLTCGSLGHE